MEEEVFEVLETQEDVTTTIDYTNLLTEIKQEINVTQGIYQKIYADVHIIMTFTILTFCWSCMRAWRKNVTKGA